MIAHLTYTYVDAANFKRHGDIYLDEMLSEGDQAAIEAKLEDGMFFIPGDLSKVTVEELQPHMTGFPSEHDHVYHILNLDDLAEADAPPQDANILSARAFVDSFKAISVWDVVGAHARLGI